MQRKKFHYIFTLFLILLLKPQWKENYCGHSKIFFPLPVKVQFEQSQTMTSSWYLRILVTIYLGIIWPNIIWNGTLSRHFVGIIL